MLAIFNPEHDLCLANGNAHYVPPRSALDFAQSSAHLMQCLYPDALCTSVPNIVNSQLSTLNTQLIVPWGWNAVLKTQLLKQGFPEEALPSDEKLDCWRNLQHRATWLALQPDCCAVTMPEGVGEMLSKHHAVVLKAPWSGSGRGIRWVTEKMSDHDRMWLQKVVREQRCVIVEPRRQVRENFALEYRVASGALSFVGYSLFQSASGVYQGNLLLSDEEIERRVALPPSHRRSVEDWLQKHIAPHYEGPLGVDFILDTSGFHHLAEINLRHTMGLVAHEYLRQHPASAGRVWEPTWENS